MATVLVAALLLGPCICPPVVGAIRGVGAVAKTRDQAGQGRQASHPPPKSAVEPAGAKAPAAPQQAKMLDPAKVDPMEIDPTQIDPKKLDAKTPNAWIALGLLEMRGGNFAGAKASFEHAMALGDQRGNKAAVAAAALVLGRLAYRSRLRFLGN